jgi:hypothetical protein
LKHHILLEKIKSYINYYYDHLNSYLKKQIIKNVLLSVEKKQCVKSNSAVVNHVTHNLLEILAQSK